MGNFLALSPLLSFSNELFPSQSHLFLPPLHPSGDKPGKVLQSQLTDSLLRLILGASFGLKVPEKAPSRQSSYVVDYFTLSGMLTDINFMMCQRSQVNLTFK